MSPFSKHARLALLAFLVAGCSAEITQKIVAIGGRTSSKPGTLSATADVEKFDLTRGANSNCAKPNDYPILDTGFTANTLGTGIVTCGGINDASRGISLCFELELKTNRWIPYTSMTTTRYDAASVVLPSGDIWVTGGWGAHFFKDVATSDLVSVDSNQKPISKPGPKLAAGFVDHCAVAVNQTHVFLGAGLSQDDDDISHNWLVNIDTEEWHRLPSIRYPRMGPGCGLVQTLDGAKGIVVAGGLPGHSDQNAPTQTTSDIFLLESEEWIPGPGLPQEYAYGGHVNPTSSTIVLAGGMDKSNPGGRVRDAIMVLDTSGARKMEDLKFEMTELKLQVPRFGFALAVIYDDDQC